MDKDQKSFLNYVDKERIKINRYITTALEDAITAEEEPFLRQFLTYAKEFVLRGGRRLLPLSLINTFLGISSEKDIMTHLENVYRVSSSIELLHIATLIVDDFIDNDTVRSGNPTFHKYMAQNIPKEAVKGDTHYFEQSSAMYGGILTSFLGTQVIAKSDFELERKSKALQYYYLGLQGMNRGHLLDDYYRLLPLDHLSLENYLILAGLKRGKQMETAVAIGGCLGNARSSQIEPLSEAMNKIGIIDQLINDYTGTFGDGAKKSTDNDIRQGQRNILSIIAFQGATSAQKKVLNSVLGNAEATDDDIENVKKIYREAGAVDFVKFYANSLKNDAWNLFQRVYPGVRQESQQYFEDLMSYLIDQAK
jgi:geranylgeranyl pyrophosphate synthase